MGSISLYALKLVFFSMTVVTRLVVVLYSERNPGLRLSFVEIAKLTLSLGTFSFFSLSLPTKITAGPVHEPI